MPRPATGQVLEPDGKRRSWTLRIRAYGKRHHITLGRPGDGWTRKKAEAELTLVLAQIEMGKWQAPVVAPAEPVDEDPTFHEFASEWLAARTPELRPATAQAYRNELVHHLLPFFHAHRLSQITVARVDAYREAKLRQAAAYKAAVRAWEARCASLRPGEDPPPRPAKTMAKESYINATITRLGAILDVADERGLIARNPVRVNPRNRKVKVAKVRKAYLDRPDQIEALLAAAGRLDERARDRADRDTCLRRPFIAAMMFGGLRISEALGLRWRDVDLAGGRMRVADSKTDAGVRWVPVLPALRDELIARKMATDYSGPNDRVFATTSGSAMSRDNARKRIFDKAVEIADEQLEAAGLAPTAEGLTPHSLRHTYISLRVALGDDPATIAQDAGHADMQVTFRIYTHVMRLQDGDRERLRALIDGGGWAETGRIPAVLPVGSREPRGSEHEKAPH